MVVARLREVGSRSIVVARPEGGGVEVDDGGTTMSKSVAWMLVARSEDGLRWSCALRPGMRWRCALGMGSRMEGGGGTMVSRVIEE
jgi:hypothetical protein